MSKDSYIKFDEIIRNIRGIEKGDIVYVISDILQLSIACREEKERFDMNCFIDKIQEKVGSDGTVLIPTFNWDFCKGKTFDIRKTVSRTGALGNAALKRDDFIRTRHPIYSFMVWGKDAELLAEIDSHESFGKDSVFDYMYKNDAKALVIGLPTMSGLTFCHYVEQMVGVPYRYSKEFTAGYIDRDGIESIQTYSMYVRDLDMDPRHIDGFRPLGNILEKNGISQTVYIDGVEFHVVDLVKMYEVVKKDILINDSANMYYYNHIC